jgi:hypothetical protein
MFFTYESPTLLYSVWQKYLTILLNSCEWNGWRAEFVLERSSSETRSISGAMERWSLERASGFCCGDVFQKQRFCLDLEDISSALQYSSERVSLVAIHLPLMISQGQRWIWNRTSGKKWQQFVPTCCNEWCRTSRNAWGNVLTTRDATSQTPYSGSECCN